MLAAGVAASVPVLVSTIRAVADGWAPTGDQAYIATSAYDVFSAHSPLIGRYTLASTVTGHATYSPGPLLYWLLAAPAHFLAPISLVVCMGLVNVGAVIGVVALAHRRGGVGFMLATAAAVAVTCASLPSESLYSFWNPYAALLPFTLLLFACWSIACGDYRLLPLAAVVASFVAQAHIVVAVPTLGVVVVALVGLVLSRRGTAEEEGSPRHWTLGALAAALACWSPPLIQQATHSPGNLVRVWQAAFASTPRSGLTGGWYALVRTVGVAPWWLRGPQTPTARVVDAFYMRPDGHVGGPGLLAVASVVLVLAGLVAAAAVAARRRRGDVVSAAAIGLVLCAAVVQADAATPVSHNLWATIGYTLLWELPAGMWVWLVLGFATVSLLRRGPTARWRIPTAPSLAAVAVIAAVSAALAAIAPANRETGTPLYIRDVGATRTLTARLAAAIPRGVTVLIDAPVRGLTGFVGYGLFRPIGAAIYALRRHGDTVLTPFEFYLGEPSYSPDHHRYDLLLEIRPSIPPPPAGALVVAQLPWAELGMVTASIDRAPSDPPSSCPLLAPGAFGTTSPVPPLHVVAGAVSGSVDTTQITGSSVWLCGWSANLHDHHAADVRIYADGRLVAVGHPTFPRADVAASEHGAPVVSGFSLWVPYAFLGSRGRRAHLTVFGVEGGMASQLPVGCAPGAVHDLGC